MRRYLFAGLGAVVLLSLLAACGSQTPAPVTTPKAEAPAAPPVARTTAAPAIPKAVEVTPTVRPKTPEKAETLPYYQGKKIEIIVGSAAGGGTDTVARITAALLPRYLPGNPSIVVRNQPSASGATAVAAFQKKTKPDGLTLMQDSSSSVSLQLRGKTEGMYDLVLNEPIAHVVSGGAPMFIRKGTMSRLLDPKAVPLVSGTKDGNESSLAISLWGKEFLGWNLRWIPGFAGTSEMELAFLRGEIDMFGANTETTRRLVKEDLIEFVGQTGTFKGNTFVRRPIYPDVPTLGELLGDKRPRGVAWDAYMAWIGPGLVDKFLEAPPGTPANVVAILRDGFTKLLRDPEFDAQIKKRFSETYEAGVGQETTDLLKSVLGTPPEAIDYMTQLQKKYGLIK